MKDFISLVAFMLMMLFALMGFFIALFTERPVSLEEERKKTIIIYDFENKGENND